MSDYLDEIMELAEKAQARVDEQNNDERSPTADAFFIACALVDIPEFVKAIRKMARVVKEAQDTVIVNPDSEYIEGALEDLKYVLEKEGFEQ